jgi:predicted MFS family arabinose efflux permease
LYKRDAFLLSLLLFLDNPHFPTGKRAIQLFQVHLSSRTTNLSLVIGLFALIGIFGVCAAPFVGRYVDRLIPWTGVLIGLAIQASGQVIVTSGGPVNISCVIIPILILDVGQQLQQVSNQMRVFAISDLARARLNACYIIALFIGQATGSRAGTAVYTRGGYHASGALSCAWIAVNVIVLCSRGPHTKKWLGWGGGMELRWSHLRKEPEGDA